MSAEATSLMGVLNDPDGDGIQRDRYDRPVLPDPITGEIKTWLRPSQLSKILDDDWALQRWEKRHIVKGIGEREDLFALAASVPTTSEPEDKAQLDKIIDASKEAAAASTKANLGTAIHRFVKQRIAGVETPIPSAWAADIEAFDKELAKFGLWPFGNYVEQFVVVPALGCAGRFDMLLTGDGMEVPMIADIKTGDVRMRMRAFSIQLAIYAQATHILTDPVNNTFAPMPKVSLSKGVIIHLPIGQGRCELFEIDIAAGWDAALLARSVHDWRKRSDLLEPLSQWAPGPARKPTGRHQAGPLAPDNSTKTVTIPVADQSTDALFVARYEWAKSRVAYVALEHGQESRLAERWKQTCSDVPTFKNDGPRSHEEIDKVAALCAEVEMAAQLPFFDPDPAKDKDKNIKHITNERNINDQQRFA